MFIIKRAGSLLPRGRDINEVYIKWFADSNILKKSTRNLRYRNKNYELCALTFCCGHFQFATM
jgi:hypothetical protein